MLALKWRGLMRSLEQIQNRLNMDQSARPEARADLVDTLVELTAKENGVPRFLARRFVGKAVDQMMADAESKARA